MLGRIKRGHLFAPEHQNLVYEAYMGLNPDDVPPAKHSTLLERHVPRPQPQASTSQVNSGASTSGANTSAPAIRGASTSGPNTSAASAPAIRVEPMDTETDEEDDPDSDHEDNQDIDISPGPVPPTTQANNNTGPTPTGPRPPSHVNSPSVIQHEVDLFDQYFPATQPQVSVPQSSIKEIVDRELTTYLSYVNLDKNVTPLCWWQIHKGELPHLSHIANKYLSSPPSSVESERLFSIGGQTYTSRRSNLSPETGERLIKLCFNLKKFNSFYDNEIVSLSNTVTETHNSPESGESAVAAVVPSGTS